MRAIDTARILWTSRFGGGFNRIVSEHLALDGCMVISADDIFVLARPARAERPSEYSAPSAADAWNITLAAGNLKRIAREIKRRCPFGKVMFSRRGIRRAYAIDNIYNRIAQWTNQTHQTQEI